MRQPENVLIVDPLRTYLEWKGWYVIKTHGNQFQAGLPDLYICHQKYSPRWIECKILGHPFTDAQRKLFPLLIQYNVPLYLIEGTDFRGVEGKPLLERAYLKLFSEPNMSYCLLPSNRRLGI